MSEHKSILRIFISHKDVNQCPSLEDAYRVIYDEVSKINTSGLHHELIEIRLMDYQMGRDLSNPHNPTFQSANSLIKTAANAHAIFTLVDGDMSPRIKKWYTSQIKKVRRESDEQMVPMPIFWNIADSDSKANCEKFHRSNDSDYIYKYSTLEELRDFVNKILQDLTRRWAQRIEYKKPIPTLESNRLKRKIKHFIYSLIFLALAVLLYLLFPKIQNMIFSSDGLDKGLTNDIPDEIVEEQPSFEGNNTPIVEPEAPKPLEPPTNKHETYNSSIKPNDTPEMADGCYILTGIEGDFYTALISFIESSSELRRMPGAKEEWTIQISQSKLECGIDDGDYFVDLAVSVNIINNRNGTYLPQIPLFKNERIMSPISYEDAFRQASSEEFAELIAKSIINSIKNEK